MSRRYGWRGRKGGRRGRMVGHEVGVCRGVCRDDTEWESEMDVTREMVLSKKVHGVRKAKTFLNGVESSKSSSIEVDTWKGLGRYTSEGGNEWVRVIALRNVNYINVKWTDLKWGCRTQETTVSDIKWVNVRVVNILANYIILKRFR